MSQNLLGTTALYLQDSSQTPEKEYFTLSPIATMSPPKCHILPRHRHGYPDVLPTLRGRKAGTR